METISIRAVAEAWASAGHPGRPSLQYRADPLYPTKLGPLARHAPVPPRTQGAAL
jgi:hypothetical protein